FDSAQRDLSDCFANVIVLSDRFHQEIAAHPIPTDLEAVRLLASARAVLDLFIWLTYRCFLAKGPASIPIFGPLGLVSQIRSVHYSREGRFSAKLDQWLDTIRVIWPGCPAKLNSDGRSFLVDQTNALPSSGQDDRRQSPFCRGTSPLPKIVKVNA